jgi:NADPH:quinone reductase-like Zn-dependent oxidoreductase
MRLALAFFLLFSSINSATAADSFRQIVITEPGTADVLQLVESAPLPEPGPGEVRLRVLTASASFTDIMVRKGIYGGIDAELPYPPGYDLVGIVDAVGEGVVDIEPGQRVADLTIWGAYTEYAIRPAAGLVVLPDAIDSEEAVVLVLSYITAYQMLYRVADIQPEQRILIHGASGAVGTALAQLGRISGLEMYGTASTAKQDYVRALGVTPIDYKTEDFVARVLEETDGDGVAVAFDAVSLDNFQRSYSVLKPNGLLVEYGLYQVTLGNSQLDLVLEFLGWQWQQLMWSWFPDEEKESTFYSIADMRDAEPEWFREDLAALFELLAEGNLQPRIWKTMPLEQAAEAHRLIESGQVQGKIVLRVSPDSVEGAY